MLFPFKHMHTMSIVWRLSLAILSVLSATRSAHGGNILVWYTEGSHWINLKPVLDTLIDRGNRVTVLVPSTSMFMNRSEPSRFRYEPFDVSVSLEVIEASNEEFLQFSIYEIDHMNYIEMYIKFIDLAMTELRNNLKYLDGVVKSETIMKRLKEAKYDLLLADPLYPGSELLADLLNLPLVFSLRFSPALNWERHCGQIPAPPSFVPGAMSKLTDTMDFSERLWNFLFYAVQDIVMQFTYWKEVDNYYSEFKGEPTSSCELMSKADIWLMRTYWDFDFPHPYLPNIKFVGGIHCRPAKPLPKDMEEFAQSSGDAGIVVFSLGSFINNITTEKANMVASALAQIPQKGCLFPGPSKSNDILSGVRGFRWDLQNLKRVHLAWVYYTFQFLTKVNALTKHVTSTWVLWRYSGKMPDTLGANTRIYQWIPQNDLLAHPKTRAFITHGGTNGIYEAIYHGVPMVGIPMFAEQPDNLVHMKAKGAAVIVNLNFINAEGLRDAINTITSDKSYKENAMRLSKIHHDRPMSPRDEAVFWIEFTMRNKGAKHLRVQAHELTWYQYHSLDVLAFLLTVALLLVSFFIKVCCFCVRRCCSRKAQGKRKSE